MSPEERETWRREGVLRIKNQYIDAELSYGLVDEIPLFPLEDLLEHYRTPMLIIHGMNDDLVPYERSLSFVAGLRYPHAEVHLYKDGDHRLNDRKEHLAELACDFLARWMLQEPPGGPV
jgi:hypothetical protein